MPRCPTVLALLAASAILAASPVARAGDVVEGRATLLASYGVLATFYQHEDADPYDPRWGHGFFFRAGGERCWVVCLGLSALGSVPLSPTGTGSIGAGPHLAYDTSGPRWAGPLTVRFGASYAWLYEEEAVFDGARVGYRAPSSEHGVGGWLELTLQLRRRAATVAPVLGLNVGYTAVLTTDPVAHVLGGRVTLGLAVSRRLVFGDSADDEEPADEEPAERAREDDEDDEDDEDEDEEDDRRLREGADTLTGW